MSRPMHAEGNLNYVEFIALVKHLWENAHPDIPLRPVQSSRYAKTPVMVYSLENRTTVRNEAKQRFRELVYSETPDGVSVQITGQRFQNTISFSAVTENNPTMGELLIETFEDFMLEYTPVFKRLGVSDIFYARRLSDREENRSDEDVEMRTVAYLVTLEKLRVTEVSLLEEILVRARIRVETMQQGAEFWVLDDLDGLYCPNANSFDEGEAVEVIEPAPDQDPLAHGEAPSPLPAILPTGLHSDLLYTVASISGDRIYLQKLNGTPAPPYAHGMGILIPAGEIPRITTEIIDDFGTDEGI